MSEPYDMQSIKELSDGDLALQGETMADLMEEHPAFKDQTLSPGIPGPTEIRENSHDVKQTSTAAKHDPTKEPDRAAARERMLQSIKFCCQYVVMYATHVNNPSLLDTIGVERARRAPRSSGVKMPKKFDKFTVTHGEESGTVKIHVNSWEGKASVQVQICYGDPALEESWQTIRMSHYCHFTLKGLEPARRAYFRARLQNDAGIGPWSDVVALIIL